MAKTAAVHLWADRFAAIVLEGTPKRWKILAADAAPIPPAEGE